VAGLFVALMSGLHTDRHWCRHDADAVEPVFDCEPANRKTAKCGVARQRWMRRATSCQVLLLSFIRVQAMPIYEYYCPENHTIYQFYAKTLAQGQTIPKCPHNPAFQMQKMLSKFSVTSKGTSSDDSSAPPADLGNAADDSRMQAALGAMESEFANMDENDPRAMARMMRRMSEMTGEKIDGETEEVVRKLEEGTHPEEIEGELGGEPPCSMPDPDGAQRAASDGEKEHGRSRIRSQVRLQEPARDPKLYDYE
jgi:predicted nucleic acid-binding Zn ribbon protein